MPKFRKRPVVIEAVRYSGEGNLDGDPPNWLWEALENGICVPTNGTDPFIIKTLEGDMTVSPGDWIIRGVNGELYPCKPNIFDETYEPVSKFEVAGPSEVPDSHLRCKNCGEVFWTDPSTEEGLVLKVKEDGKKELFPQCPKCGVSDGPEKMAYPQDYSLPAVRSIKEDVPITSIPVNVGVKKLNVQFPPLGILSEEKCNEVERRVIDTICEQLDINRRSIKPESNLAEDFMADSLDHAELMMEFEDAFDLDLFDEDEAAGLVTVKQITEAIIEKLGKKKAHARRTT